MSRLDRTSPLRDIAQVAQSVGGIETHKGEGDGPGMDEEAEAFARLICSRHVTAPLSIGVFGDWGTGKSFFMGRMQTAIKRRCEGLMRAAEPLDSDSEAQQALEQRWHTRVAQITFNAWHYAEPNLWASLVTRVFDELADIISPQEPVQDTRARLLAQVADGKELRDQAALELAKAEQHLVQAREEQLKCEQDLTACRDALSVLQAAKDLTVQGDAPQQSATEGAARSSGAITVKGPVAALRVTLRWLWSRGWAVRIMLILALVLVVAGALLALASWRGWIDLSPYWPIASMGFSIVAGVVGTLLAWWLRVKPRLDAAHKVYQHYRGAQAAKQAFLARAVGDLLNPYEQTLAEARRQLQQAEVGLHSAKLAEQEAATSVAEAQRSLQDLDAGHRFYALIRERKDSDDYRKHLGLVSLIRKDFEQLAEVLKQVEDEGPFVSSESVKHPPPVSRIVIYIDDLDRCEPDRVVEVLQAVHLLLATSIFVVVVAGDIRWLQQSLSLYYARILGPCAEGEVRSTPRDYLEKVFQIPFLLQPMGSESFAAMVDGLVGNEGEDSSAEEVIEPLSSQELDDTLLTLNPTELSFIKSLHAVIETPRMAKAMVNSYLVMRSGLSRDALDDYLGEAVYRGVLTLLAIWVGRGGEAIVLFEVLEDTETPTLGALLDGLIAEDGASGEEQRCTDWRALKDAVIAVGVDELQVALLRQWSRRVQRFSFSPWTTTAR